ncbi:hypothetical protein PHABIO_299 [Pseudomonas phage Phabio]|uniref:Uncharacterized protein n=1 Tax=Pseudomonas phage Phabio TaxID=2006668 RepID=A0A1Y0SUB1_9CAUD|nr:hypothetical protein MZD05_gp299 [Pseudomonas phage Phabio]ARV76930.1 hypothetical protein PHABIO_299 [Pseudomonas phage Phabio]
MQGKGKEYSEKRGWFVKHVVNKQRKENSIPREVFRPPDEDNGDNGFIDDYQRDGIPDPDANYNGRQVY